MKNIKTSNQSLLSEAKVIYKILKLPMEFLISFIQLERKEIAFNVNKSHSEK